MVTPRGITSMDDIYDVIAFCVLAAIVAAIVAGVVTLGTLPGRIAYEREHPYAAIITLASWVGIAMLALGVIMGGAEVGSLSVMALHWPLAFVWAFFKTTAASPPKSNGMEASS